MGFTASQFAQYTDELVASCQSHPDFIGLVLAGSTAETERADEWSDHDFLAICRPGVDESLRQDLSWLPRHEEIAFAVRETAHGLKVLYRDGHLLEFAVFDVEVLRQCPLNHVALAFGDESVEEALAQALREVRPGAVDVLRDYKLFLSLLLIGSGRARRGEVLSGSVFIKSYALGNLLRAVESVRADDARLDRLDPWRRVEQVLPEFAGDVAAALLLEPVGCARALVEAGERQLLGFWDEYPAADMQVVRELLSR